MAATVGVWLGLGLLIRSAVILRSPPGGELVWTHGSKRAFLVEGVDAQDARELLSWASDYSASVLDGGKTLAANWRQSLDSGDVATVSMVRGPRSVELHPGRYVQLGSGDVAVSIRDEDISLTNVYARLRVALPIGL